MNIIIFGPPGAGKGTQAQNIASKFHLHQVSTGDLLRNEIKKKTDIGKEIEQLIAKGDFVSERKEQMNEREPVLHKHKQQMKYDLNTQMIKK